MLQWKVSRTIQISARRGNVLRPSHKQDDNNTVIREAAVTLPFIWNPSTNISFWKTANVTLCYSCAVDWCLETLTRPWRLGASPRQCLAVFLVWCSRAKLCVVVRCSCLSLLLFERTRSASKRLILAKQKLALGFLRHFLDWMFQDDELLLKVGNLNAKFM